MYLSVVIPAFNEEKRIEKTLRETSGFLHKQAYDHEIIIVNDGSQDKTVELIEGLKIPFLRVISNANNKGKGYSVRRGLLAAQGQYRLFMDADNSTAIREIEKFLPYAATHDVLIGSRAQKESIILKQQIFYRRLLGKLWGFLVGRLAGLGEFKDTQCGFKLVNASTATRVLPLCKVDGWAFDLELLLHARKMGYTIKEIPVTWMNDSQSKVRFSGMWRMLWDLLRVR